MNQLISPIPTSLERPRPLIRRNLATVLFGQIGVANYFPRKLCLTHGPRSSRSVALTFDDGPHPDHTPPLLDALRDAKIRATFFVLGRQVERYPDLALRIINEGHALGSHTVSHLSATSSEPDAYVDEVMRTQRMIHFLTDRRALSSRLMRPPFGQITFQTILGLWKNRQTIVFWNVNLKDYVADTSTEAVLGIAEAHAFRSGDIVLMHDNQPHAAKVISGIARHVRSQGLDFTTVDQWTGG